MAQLINRTGNDVTLYAVQGEAGAFHVAADEPVDVPGDVMNEESAETDGFYLIGEGAAALSWPMSAWELVGSKAPARTARKNQPKEGGE